MLDANLPPEDVTSTDESGGQLVVEKQRRARKHLYGTSRQTHVTSTCYANLMHQKLNLKFKLNDNLTYLMMSHFVVAT